MRKAPASSLLAVATAVCAVVLFGACKTVRTSERWRKGSTGVSQYEKRMDNTVQRNIAELNALAAGDETADYTSSNFDTKASVDTESGLFGKKKFAGSKDFRTKDFAGASEFKGQDYHFLKRQDYQAPTSPDQDQRFATDTAPDQKKRFLDRFKRAPTKEFAESTRMAPANDYRDTKLELERLDRRDPTIVQDDAADAGATLTVDDVRTMLHGAN